MSSAPETGGEPSFGMPRDPIERRQPEARSSVLIADDSKVIRARLVSILETLPGVELRVAADGLETLALAKERRPDLLLCDHEMPGMNGIQLLRVLRATWSRFELPILMLTANSATETKVMAFQHGANDYVTKPVEPAELCARVRGQLDLKRAIHENLAARVQLLEARKYQAVGRLAAGVAHELNNPAQYTSSNLSYLRKSYASMQAILTSTLEWAKREQGSHSFARRIAEQSQALRLDEILGETPIAVDEAMDGIRRMATVIAEMKEFAGEPNAQAAELEVNQALRNTVEVSRPMWSPVLRVQLELEPELPAVRGLAHQVKQAFLNVLTNAVEAIGSQQREPGAGVVQIRTSRVGGGVEVTFTDDGPGMHAALQAHIFDPFFTTKGRDKGTGLGLSVSHGIAKEHGGEILVETRIGEGTRFIIDLPA
jgi:two-component system, NtrC family, sensor kinase